MSSWKVFALIAVAVAGWGVFHAVGAYRYNHDVRRAVVVLACVVAFLAFWGAMLYSRKRRISRNDRNVV